MVYFIWMKWFFILVNIFRLQVSKEVVAPLYSIKLRSFNIKLTKHVYAKRKGACTAKQVSYRAKTFFFYFGFSFMWLPSEQLIAAILFQNRKVTTFLLILLNPLYLLFYPWKHQVIKFSFFPQKIVATNIINFNFKYHFKLKWDHKFEAEGETQNVITSRTNERILIMHSFISTCNNQNFNNLWGGSLLTSKSSLFSSIDY